MTIQSNRRGVRFLAAALFGLASAGSAAAQGGVYQEEGGLLVIELESAHHGGHWREETSVSGFTGSAYLRWDGPNHFGQPGNDPFAFEFDVHQAGRYHFRIRNRHDHPDRTEENDVWVRMDGGAWIKCFSGQRGQWTWATNHELSHNNKPPAEYQLSAGRHRIEFSGRSYNFIMDRFHLFTDAVSDPYNPNHPESSTDQPNMRPIPAVRVAPRAVAPNDSGQTVVTLDARRSLDPDGDNLSFEWQVRGARFVLGTRPTDVVARVVVDGGFAVPVRLIVRDDDPDEPETAVAFGVIDVAGSEGTFHGAGVAWHPMELRFEGPNTSETSNSPNPFLDFRLNVTFQQPNGGDTVVVPGFYAGDGEGGSSGNVWAVRFSPEMAGIWGWSASFRTGAGVAVDLSATAGTATHFDGAEGHFGVLPRDPNASGFLSQGRLEYVGEHYLKFRDGGYFIKGGTNSPENFLGYAGFDDVQDNGGVGIIHRYAPHAGDFRPGDPMFQSSSTGVNSRCIIGALNYLGSQGVNALYFLPMNLGGDGQETCPFVGYGNNSYDKTHYDVSRLHQWNQVFDHAQRQGILLHFVLAETEINNEQWLDNGHLGVERKLFFREMAARFGHALALKWNLSEENDYPIARLREFATYLRAVDAYDHPIAVHTHPNDLSDYSALVGDPLFSAASVQYATNQAGSLTTQVRNMSHGAGRKWVTDMDENGTWNVGLSDSNADQMRREVLYDVLFSGGQIEWYAGYHNLPLGGDVKMEDFRTREQMWTYMRYAREFMEEHLPFWQMMPGDHLVTGEANDFGGAECFARGGQVYAIYLPRATQAPTLDLSGHSGTFSVTWFNPRNGTQAANGPSVQGGAPRLLNVPISDVQADWVILVERN